MDALSSSGDSGNNAENGIEITRSGSENHNPDHVHVHDDQDSVELIPEMVSPLNPMKIHLNLEFLDILFEHCSVESLKICRLVCKLWRDISLKAWRNSATLRPRAHGSRKLKNYVKLLHSDDDDGLLRLKRHPFRKMQIDCKTIDLQQFSKKSAKPVTDVINHLVLDRYINVSTASARLANPVLPKQFLPRFKSLETLELHDSHWRCNSKSAITFPGLKNLRIRTTTRDGWFFGNLSIGWENLIFGTPSLETLKLEFRTDREYIAGIRRVLRIAKVIRSAEGGERELGLKELGVTHAYKEGVISCMDHGDIIQTIMECKFPLEKLSLHLCWGGIDLQKPVHPMFPLLESCKEKLEYLETSFNFNASNDAIKYYLDSRRNNPFTIRMPKLKEVRIRNGIWGLHLLSTLELPSIVKLVVDNVEYVDTMDATTAGFKPPFPNNRVYETLETFEFLDTRSNPGPEMIKAFAKMMPNLVNLTFPLDKYTFQVVCESMKGLKTLKIPTAQHRVEQLDDESLTGVSKGKDPDPGDQRMPNITDLALLTDFIIECEGDHYPAFTGHSVIHGFLLLPRLYFLSVSFKEISEEVKAKLMNHVKGPLHIHEKDKMFIPKYYCNVQFEIGNDNDSA